MSGFFKVPNDVYDAFAKSDPPALMVYICLARNAAYSDRVSPYGYEVRRGECDMTLKQVADEVGITKSSARTRIEKLTQIGSISARRATQRRNVITLHCQALAGDQRTDSARTAHELRTVDARTTHVESQLSKTKTKTKTKTNEDIPPTPLEQNQSEGEEPPPKAKGKPKRKPLKDRMAQLDESIQTEAFQAYWRTYQQQVRPGGAPSWRRTWCAWEDCNGEEHAEEIMAGLRAYAARVAAEAENGKRFAYSAYRWLDERIWESMADAGAPNQAVSAVRWQGEPLGFE